MRPRHSERACHSVYLDHHLALGETEIGGIATQGRKELNESLPSVDAFWGEDLFQPREVASVQEIKVTSDQTAFSSRTGRISLSPSRRRRMHRLPRVIGPPRVPPLIL